MGKVTQEAGEPKAPSHPHKSGPSILPQEGGPSASVELEQGRSTSHTAQSASLPPPHPAFSGMGGASCIQPLLAWGERAAVGRVGAESECGSKWPPLLLNLVLHLCK